MKESVRKEIEVLIENSDYWNCSVEWFGGPEAGERVNWDEFFAEHSVSEAFIKEMADKCFLFDWDDVLCRKDILGSNIRFLQKYLKPTKWKGWYYNFYLYSDHWINLREEILDKHNNTCQQCHKKYKRHQLNVHHLNYKTLGVESEEDFILVCRECHGDYHPNHKRKENKEYRDNRIKTYKELSNAKGCAKLSKEVDDHIIDRIQTCSLEYYVVFMMELFGKETVENYFIKEKTHE